MSKNLMPEILKLLGVDYGEQFKLHNKEYTFGDDLFMFNKDEGLFCIYPNGSIEILNNVLYDILNGNYEVVKLPYRPQMGDKYWMLDLCEGIHIVDYIWDGDILDLLGLNFGIVYRTREEAEAHMAEDFKKLTGISLEVEE